MSKKLALHAVTTQVSTVDTAHSFTEQYLTEHLTLDFVSIDPNVEVVAVATTLVSEEDSETLSKYLNKSWYIQDGRIEVNGYNLESLETDNA